MQRMRVPWVCYSGYTEGIHTLERKVAGMGKCAEEALEITPEELSDYLRRNHSVYMKVGDTLYYLTDVNSHEWRAQDTTVLNDKGHFTDCSDLVFLVDEFLALPFIEGGKSINDVAGEATFYASEGSGAC